MTTTRRTARMTKPANGYMARAEQATAIAAPTKIAAIAEPAKATKPGRGYVAFEMKHIAPSIDMVTMTANKSFSVLGANGAHATIWEGEKFTAVRAGSLGPDMWYIVRNVTGTKKCSCPANKPCKHEIAVQAKQAKAAVVVPQISEEAKAKQEETALYEKIKARAKYASQGHEDAVWNSAPLNGNRGFSLFR